MMLSDIAGIGRHQGLRHQKEIDEGRAKKIAVIVGKEAEVC